MFGTCHTLAVATTGRRTITVTHASWPELVGDELIQSGNMSVSTGWNQPTGSAIAGGKMNWAAVASFTGATNDGASAPYLISNTRYLYSIDLSNVLGGTVSVFVGDEAGAAWGGNGTGLSEVLTAVDPLGDGFKLSNESGVAATLSIDNVSLKTFQQMGGVDSWDTVSPHIYFASDGGINTGPSLDIATDSDVISLTGGSKTAFDAANTINTACNYTFYVQAYNNNTSFEVRAREGSWVEVDINADNDPTTVALTTGSGSGFDIRGISGGGETASCVIYLIRPVLA